jgi:hypothetical protein
MINLKSAFQRRRIFNDLIEQFQGDIDSLEKCAIRLYECLPDKKNLDKNTVLLPFGGGKDSSFAAVVARLIQLLIYREFQNSFQLRYVTNLQPGMAYGVLDNIDRVYRSLGINEDPLCDTILVDGTQIVPFHVNHRFSEAMVNENRTDVLVNGHLTRASNRATFCNACNFSMVRSYALTLAYERGADLVITGDSIREQRAYAVAVERTARDLDIESAADSRGFARMLLNLDGITNRYNMAVHGATVDVTQRQIIHKPPKKIPKFFSLYEEMRYEAGHHWDLLVGYLGFEFHELAFSFTESDCANPALMAHLRGLRAEHLWEGRSYHDGVIEYRDFAIGLMRRKSIPEKLIKIMEDRYSDSLAINRVRDRVAKYANDVFGLSEERLICMIYSPFVDCGDRLESYLCREKPDFISEAAKFHDVLKGNSNSPALVSQLQDWSGLPIDKLRHVYGSRSVDNYVLDSSDTHPIRLMFLRDPHQAVISTKHSLEGPEILEVESGR